jgi:hypothetical protein
MHGQIHANYVLYKSNPKPGEKYRQIVVVEMEQFQVRILGGEVLHPDPQFAASSEDAEVTFHPSLKSALDDAKKEFDNSQHAGWIKYP